VPNSVKTRERRAEQILAQAAADVRYEIEMLVYSSAILGLEYGSPATTPTNEHWNMALESFLVHFRNLRAFLCPSLQPTYDDDVIASDFLGDPQARDIGDVARLAVDRQRLNRMLAHLSYSRDKYIRSGESIWRIAELTAIVLDEFEKFLGQLPDERILWFPSREALRKHRSGSPSQRLA